jgi:hypothetical protein
VHEPDPESRRIVLALRKRRIGWYPKPTVVFGGRGHPAQWGSGTWQVASDEPTTMGVFLYNRMWTFGSASITLDPGGPTRLVYRAPWLPFLPGRIAADSE